MKFKIRLKLLHQFLLIFSILIVIPLSILFSYTYTKMSSMIRENILNSTEQAFNQSCTFISYKLDRLYDTINSLVLDENITSILQNDAKNYTLPNQIHDLETLRSYALSYQNNIDISDVKFYVNDDFMYSHDRKNIFPISNLDNSAWLESCKKNNSRYYWAPSSYIANNNKNSIVLGKTILHPDDYNNILGYLFLEFSRDDLDKIIGKINSSPNSFSCILNSDNDVISSSNYELSTKYKDFITSKNFENKSLVKFDSSDFYIQSADIDKTDWRIITVVPYSIIDKEITTQRVYLVFIVLFFGGAALLVGYIFFNSITKRLSLVINGMRDVHADNLDNFIENNKDDELGELIDNYNYMIAKISRLNSEQYKMGKAVKNAELKALQSQINPHFLYNTLDMINWMAYKNMTTEISTAVKSLAKFYKLSLNKGKDITYISDEIQHVSLYVKIQNMRYENRIIFSENVDEEIKKYLIPKITLQPLVENAINHGILNRGHVIGHIIISGYIDADTIYLKVSDDGIGMHEEELHSILSSSEIKSKGSGYGIKNINQRIKLLYGDSFGLSFESTYDVGTTVTIKLPLIENIEDNKNL